MHHPRGTGRASRWLITGAILLGLSGTTRVAGAQAADGFPGFIPMPGVTAEGVAFDKAGGLYVSVRDGMRGLIWKYWRTGEPALVAEIGPGLIGGLAMAANGDLFAAVAAGPGRGVYRIDSDGSVEQLPGTGAMLFANALAFDQRGALYVTESFSMTSPTNYGPGGVWRIAPGGGAEPWVRHPLLTGIGAVLGYPVGANGIAFYHGDLYVANTDKGLVVRIPVLADGSPGEPEVWATLGPVAGSPLSASPTPVMGDGLALDVHGNVYVAVVSRAAVVRINADDRSQETVAALLLGAPGPPQPAPLDTPASLAFGTGAGEQQQLFVTNLGMMSAMVPGPPWPGSGLVKIEAGFPGRPLR